MDGDTKYTLEFLVAVFIHPLAVMLIWINLANRSDLSPNMKAFWAVVAPFFWIVGPMSYLLVGGGKLISGRNML